MMCGKGPRRRAQPGQHLGAALLVLLAAGGAAPVQAEGLWDSLLETMNVKATPAGPGPDFVERTRPDLADLGYLPTATPHKVSPVAVKSVAEIQAKKDALDLAKARQLNPSAGKPPVQIVKGAPVAAPRPAPGAEPRTAAKSPTAGRPAAFSD